MVLMRVDLPRPVCPVNYRLVSGNVAGDIWQLSRVLSAYVSCGSVPGMKRTYQRK